LTPREFTARVLAVVRRIPTGRVATYGDVAAMAGRPRAARAVGNIMKGLGRSDVPAHRVIAAGGRLGGYGGNESMKRALLVAEGISVSHSRIRLQEYRWSGPTMKPQRANSPKAQPQRTGKGAVRSAAAKARQARRPK
jgi:O-6-methylguanine DNA methyltransferase